MGDLAGVHPYVWLLSPSHNQAIPFFFPFFSFLIFSYFYFLFFFLIPRLSHRIASSGKIYRERVSTVTEIGAIPQTIQLRIYLCEA